MTSPLPTVIDGLVFPGPSLFGENLPFDELRGTHRRAGIDGAVLAAPRHPDYDTPAANALVAKLARTDARTRQLGRIDPHRPDALDEVRRCVEVYGVAGFYLSPREEVFTINGLRAAPALEAIAEHALPVVIESGVPWVAEALQVADVALRHPGVSVVMTNGGQFNMSGLGQAEAFQAMDLCPDLRLHTSGVYRQDFIEGAVARYGADRVIFASAAPRFDPSYELLRVLGADVTAEERATVAGGAALSLFW